MRTRVVDLVPPRAGVPSGAEPGAGALHVLRRGELLATQRRDSGEVYRARITTPSLLFSPWPVEHTLRAAPGERPEHVFATVHFRGGESHPLMRALPPLVVLPLADLAGAEGALALLASEIDNVRCGRRLVADRLFEVVLIQILRWLLDHPDEAGLPFGLLTGLADPRLAPLLVALHESPERRWTLAEMSRFCTMSRSAFSARFTRLLGQSPADYLTGWRLSLARERLDAGEPVSAVAAELGFSSSSAFSRTFSRELGCSPRDWRAAQS